MAIENIARRSVLLGSAAAVGSAVTGLLAQPGGVASDFFHSGTPSTLMALEPADVDVIATVAAPSRFSGIDPTGASDSSAGLQAAMDATPEGGTLLIPAGTYLVSAPLTPRGGKSVSISGYGARLVATTNQSAISLRSDYDAVIGVRTIQNQSVAFPNGVSELTTVLTLATAPAWSAGDVIKIVSDDVIEGSRPSSSRIGEFAVVYSVAGTSVTLAGRVREAYKSNIRTARIGRQSISVVGLELETAPSRIASNNEALLSFTRVFNPKILDVKIVRSGGQVCRFASCFGYLVQNMDVAFARDSAGESALGYGVLDNQSSFGRIIGGTFRHLRHAYTDDTPNTTAGNPDLATFGRTYGTILVGVHAMMTTSTSFSTHHSSEGVVFSSCRASGGVPAGTQSGGFELRGKGHRVVDCTANQVTNGLIIRTESGGGESWGHYISNFKGESLRHAALRFEIHSSGHPSQNKRDTKVNAVIDGLLVTDTMRMMYSDNSVVSLSSATYIAPPGVEGTYYEAFYTRNSELQARNIVMDYSYNTAGLPRPFTTGTTSGRTPGRQDSELTNVEFRITPSVAQRAYYGFGGKENRIRGRHIRFSSPFPFMPGESHPSSTWDWDVDYEPDLARSDLSSAYHLYKSTGLQAGLLEVVKSNDHRVTIQVNAESKKITINDLPPGRRRGQEWVFIQTTNGETTFLNGPAARTNLKAGANRVLWRARRLELTWDGALWQEMLPF